MAEPFILEVKEGGVLQFPPALVQSFDFREGSKVFAREKEGRIILTSEEQEKLEGFRLAVEKLRKNVKKAGGITAKEIEDTVRKVRAEKAKGRQYLHIRFVGFRSNVQADHVSLGGTFPTYTLPGYLRRV